MSVLCLSGPRMCVKTSFNIFSTFEQCDHFGRYIYNIKCSCNSISSFKTLHKYSKQSKSNKQKPREWTALASLVLQANMSFCCNLSMFYGTVCLPLTESAESYHTLQFRSDYSAALQEIRANGAA